MGPDVHLSLSPKQACRLPGLRLFPGAPQLENSLAPPLPPLDRLAKKKKTVKKKKVKSEEAAVPSLPAPAGGQAVGKEAGRPWATPESDLTVSTEAPALGQLGLRIPEMKDTAMERVGQALSKVIDSLEATDGWGRPLEPPDQSFRTDLPGDPPSEGPSLGGFGQGLPSPMDFYRFTVENPNIAATGGGHHDSAGHGQPPHVPGGPEAPGQEEEGGEGEAAGPAVASSPGEAVEMASTAALSRLKEDRASPSPSSAEDSGVEEGQGSPSEAAHPSEFR